MRTEICELCVAFYWPREHVICNKESQKSSTIGSVVVHCSSCFGENQLVYALTACTVVACDFVTGTKCKFYFT